MQSPHDACFFFPESTQFDHIVNVLPLPPRVHDMKHGGVCVSLCVCLCQRGRTDHNAGQAEEHVCGPVLGCERHANLDQNVALETCQTPSH